MGWHHPHPSRLFGIALLGHHCPPLCWTGLCIVCHHALSSLIDSNHPTIGQASYHTQPNTQLIANSCAAVELHPLSTFKAV